MKRQPQESPALPGSMPVPRPCLCLEIASMDYGEAWDLQSRLVEARRTGVLPDDVVLFLEHPSVFTLGRRGGRENLLVSEAFLERAGIPVVHVERGGNITYHGPGQIVGYPILDLRGAGLDVTEYVERLEEIMIGVASDFGVHASRDSRNRGVWVGNRKLGSIGIAIRHGISFHGLAFNVNLSMEPFGWINPCGLEEVGMTSLERELSERLPMERVLESAKNRMQSVLGLTFKVITLPAVKELLGCAGDSEGIS
jgi:lipoate-protein ligase B